MKHRINKLGEAVRNVGAKLSLAAVLIHASVAQAALPKVDLTQDASGGKNIGDVANNVGGGVDSLNSLALAIAAFAGLIITILSAYTIYKAGKEEREKPTSAVVGIIVGGLMLAIPTIMWLSRNTIIGT